MVCAPEDEFVVRLYLSLFSPPQCDFFLTLQCEEGAQLVFRGDCFICSCRFTAFMGGGELRILLCQHLEPWSLKLGFPDSSVGRGSACKIGEPGSIPGSARSAGEMISYPLQYSWASLVAQLVKNLPAMREIWD